MENGGGWKMDHIRARIETFPNFFFPVKNAFSIVCV